MGVGGEWRESVVLMRRSNKSRHCQIAPASGEVMAVWVYAPARVGAVRIPRRYTTALRLAASRNHAALSLGVRFCVLKSTYTSPNRSPYPLIHSKLSIVLHWK